MRRHSRHTRRESGCLIQEKQTACLTCTTVAAAAREPANHCSLPTCRIADTVLGRGGFRRAAQGPIEEQLWVDLREQGLPMADRLQPPLLAIPVDRSLHLLEG